MLAFILHLVSITDTYCIRMYDFIHIIRFFKIPPFELDFQNDPGKCDFFHFSFGKLMLYSYLKFLVVFDFTENVKVFALFKRKSEKSHIFQDHFENQAQNRD